MAKEKNKTQAKQENISTESQKEPQEAPRERRNSDRHTNTNGDNTYKTLFLVLLAICISFGVQYVINQKNSTEPHMGIVEAIEKRLAQEKQDLMQIISSLKEEFAKNIETSTITTTTSTTTQETVKESIIDKKVEVPKIEDSIVDEQPQILLNGNKPVVVIDMQKEIREKEEKEKEEREAAEKREAERIETERRLNKDKEEQEKRDAKERQKRAYEDRERRKKLEAENNEQKKQQQAENKNPPKAKEEEANKNPVKKNEEQPVNIPDEIKNFKSIIISEMKPKKMWIPIPGSNGGHRRVPAIEVRPGKEHGSSVKVWLYDEFLSDEEADNLVKVHQSHVARLKQKKPIICFDTIRTLRKHLQELKREKIADNVTPNDFIPGTMCINQTFSRQLEKWGLKWSFSTAFYPGESKFSNYFGRRIEEATQLNETHGGKFQITSYPFGVGYKAHHDCLLDSDEQRDRYATFLVYLNDLGAEGGGETIFTKLGIDVKPRRGRALTWNNMNYAMGKCEDASIHEANPVKDETKSKFIIQRWYYYKNFYALGKRAQEPKLPDREPETPKVSCDEYDFGSCRLYDEWNWDHLVEYHNKKNILY